MLQKIQWLTLQVRAWVHQASRGVDETGEFIADPELYAEVMLNNLPPFITDEEIEARLSAPDALEQLAQLNPDVAKYPEWFARLRQAILDSFTDAGDMETDEGADDAA